MTEQEGARFPDSTARPRGRTWLTHSLERLIIERSAQKPLPPVDAVIVGSGYGGAVAAAELAKADSRRSVYVLERGREYLPGSFPARMAELPGHVRFSTARSGKTSGYREGLFDVRIGPDVCAVVANGVGGGSLINAGVMLEPSPEAMEDSRWPAPVRDFFGQAGFGALTSELLERLGATMAVDDARISTPVPRKFDALRDLYPERFKAVPLTIALADGVRSDAQIPRSRCLQCGDCVTGCNYDAKLSLDVTLLADAVRHGARVYAGTTVLRLERVEESDGSPCWDLHLVHTNETLRRRQGQPFLLRARRVVLSAGSLGSTEILRRSQPGLVLSARLGCQFSTNGDLIAAAYDTTKVMNCVGEEGSPPQMVAEGARVGPTITGSLALDGCTVQDIAIPRSLRKLLDEVLTTSAALDMLGESDAQPHPGGLETDPLPVDPARVLRSLPLVLMSRDPADGLLCLDSPGDDEGSMFVRWPALRNLGSLTEQHDLLARLLESAGINGRLLANPLWRPVPRGLEGLIDEAGNGPLITVHPLGGCPMGDSAHLGVVDQYGQVYDPVGANDAVHPGLVVLDGSIIPTALGTNPALTIATLALRSIRHLKQAWGFQNSPEPVVSGDLAPRPSYREPPEIAPESTKIEILERLSGSWNVPGGPPGCFVELTMRFDPVAVRDLVRPNAALNLSQGRLRVFENRPQADIEPPDESALLVAGVSGRLTAFQLEETTVGQRRWRALNAWLRNRGLRDTWQWLIDERRREYRRTAEQSKPVQRIDLLSSVRARIRGAWAIASRAGAVRRLEYRLAMSNLAWNPDRGKSEEVATLRRFLAEGREFVGLKRLTYSRRANPWRQLSQGRFRLEPEPRAPKPKARAGIAQMTLTLDTAFLARQGTPLLRVVGQQDQPGALVDLASLALFVARVVLHQHLWSFRAPDRAPALKGVINRLPCKVPGLPPPTCSEHRVGTARNGVELTVRLVRYPQRDAPSLKASNGLRQAIATPVLLIHGYSASGTTFAHHAVRPNLAQALWESGRDVWIADLRTSAGMPFATEPWTFEEVAYADIPVAIRQVLEIAGCAQVDVFAHCMGSAMLAMALLGPTREDEPFPGLRQGLGGSIRRLVISQVPPAMIFTADNLFRAYAMRYLKYYLPLGNYQFRLNGPPGITDQLLDRLLATLPYPECEFDRENPLWPPWRRTPWVGTRHRMDALYGRDFNLRNMSRTTLEHIDELFGPLNLDTVSQVIHFARYKSITTADGRNDFVSPEALSRHFDFPILLVHGTDNGLVSPSSVRHFETVLGPEMSDARLQTFQVEHFGHQDCLIGKNAGARVFPRVVEFFNQESSGAP